MMSAQNEVANKKKRQRQKDDAWTKVIMEDVAGCNLLSYDPYWLEPDVLRAVDLGPLYPRKQTLLAAMNNVRC